MNVSFFPAGSPSCGGDVTVYAFDINWLSFPIPFYYVLVYISVFIAISNAFFLSIHFPDNSPFSHSVLPVLPLSYWSFELLSLYESLLQP